MNDKQDREQVVNQMLKALEKAWHSSDARGFAHNFTTDADFVDVLGRLIQGREAIARVHQRNFETIHVETRLSLKLIGSQGLTDNLVLAHVRASLHVPVGPLAGDSLATQTMVLVNAGGGWQIRAFHNTFVREIPGVPKLGD
jgi:uncharacterized protein (TIGR02246 family)